MDDRTVQAQARSYAGYFWILLLIVAAIRVPALFHPFFLDDYVYVDKARDLSWRGVVNIVTHPALDSHASAVWWVPDGVLPFYRPIGQLTFGLDYALWGLRPFGFHLTNLLLHLVCAVLAWRLARRLFDKPLYAVATGIVFVVHPIHSEAVMWISGRFDLLVCVCVLASVLSYLNWRDTAACGWGLASLGWFALGLGCKETALILPVVLLGVELLGGRCQARCAYRRLAAAIAFGAVSLGYVAVRISLFGSFTGTLPPPYGLDLSNSLGALRDLAWNLGFYLMDLVLAIHIEPVYLSQFWRDNPVLFGLALAVSVVLLAAAVRAGRSRALLIGVAWLAIFTAPSLLSMPGERNVYLASVGLAVVIAAVFRALDSRDTARVGLEGSSGRRRWVRPAACGVITLWLVLCLVHQTMAGLIIGAAEKVYRDLAAILPDPPPNARIYVVQLSPLNSVGFTQAIRLRYGREDISGCALSLSPTLRVSSADEILPVGPDAVRVVRAGGVFLDSFVERFHRFGEPASQLPDAARRAGLELLNPPAAYDDLTAVEFRLPYRLNDPRLEIFRWDNRQIRGKLDLLWAGSLTELKRCKPAVVETARTE